MHRPRMGSCSKFSWDNVWFSWVVGDKAENEDWGQKIEGLGERIVGKKFIFIKSKMKSTRLHPPHPQPEVNEKN